MSVICVSDEEGLDIEYLIRPDPYSKDCCIFIVHSKVSNRSYNFIASDKWIKENGIPGIFEFLDMLRRQLVYLESVDGVRDRKENEHHTT